MSRPTDAGHFFQTDTSQQDIQRKSVKSKNTSGSPIRLDSKLLGLARDPLDSGRIYVAESAGTVRRVVLETGEKSHVYRGPSAPVTSLAFNTSGATLFAGCWDKSVWSWDVHSRQPASRYFGHTDFVKSVVCTTLAHSSTSVKGTDEAAGAHTGPAVNGGVEILISGSADATIIVWAASTGEKLHILKGHTRGVLDLAIDPASMHTVPSSSSEGLIEGLILFSGGSDREIRRWQIKIVAAKEMETQSPVLAHETSINRLHFLQYSHSDNDREEDGGDLWTASSDNTARCLTRQHNWRPDTTLLHPDFVRDVVFDEGGGWVVTACRDEEVRVWDAGSGKLACVFSGHYEEVTGLLLMDRHGEKGRRVREVISVGIDGTIRRWDLSRENILKVKEAAEKKAEAVRNGEVIELAEVRQKMSGKGRLLTEDEERELAELMDDDVE